MPSDFLDPPPLVSHYVTISTPPPLPFSTVLIPLFYTNTIASISSSIASAARPGPGLAEVSLVAF